MGAKRLSKADKKYLKKDLLSGQFQDRAIKEKHNLKARQLRYYKKKWGINTSGANYTHHDTLENMESNQSQESDSTTPTNGVEEKGSAEDSGNDESDGSPTTSGDPTTQQYKCGGCGSFVDEGMRFCSACGERLLWQK